MNRDPNRLGRVVEAVDSHTEGEPTRVITGGLGTIPGDTMKAKSDWLRDQHDAVRRALVLEPRGHEAIVLAYLTDPVSANAHAGVVYANDAGYLGMCGHGTIGLATTLVRLGHVEAREPVTEVVLDTPVGQVSAVVRVENGRPRSVAVRNVPAFVQDENLEVTVPGIGDVRLDIAYGGNWFGILPGDRVGLPVEPERLDELMPRARAIRDAIENRGVVGRHPATGVEGKVDHIVIWADESRPGEPACRALTLCPGRAYDRSPCGTGTSARMALLSARGELQDGEVYRCRSILGTVFSGRIVGRTEVGGRAAVIPEIEGSAYVTGVQQFVLDPDDPLVHGFG